MPIVISTLDRLNLGPPDGYFCDELIRWLFHENSLSNPKDLLIPFIGEVLSIAVHIGHARSRCGPNIML
jgi:hypothetical protein